MQSQIASGGFKHNGGMEGFGEFYARGMGDLVIGSYVPKPLCRAFCMRIHVSSAGELVLSGIGLLRNLAHICYPARRCGTRLNISESWATWV